MLGSVPAHVSLRSVKNVSAERVWGQLVKHMHSNAAFFHDRGISLEIFDPEVPMQKSAFVSSMVKRGLTKR